MRLFRTYFRHVCEHPKSILARVYGLYSVTMGEQKPVRMIVMGNTMRVQQSTNIQYVFDLKGSMVNRIVKDTTKLKPSAPLKDQNLLKLCERDCVKLLRF